MNQSPTTAAAKEVTLVVQIDGKVRERISAPAGISTAAAEELALASEKVKVALEGRIIVRKIVVPDRLVNIVTKQRS